MSDVLIPQVMPWLGEAEAQAAYDTVASNWLSEGPRCAEFSRVLRELIGAEYGVFAPNGTLALALGLQALGIGPGDEVLVPDTTFIGSANAVLMVGATPIFTDVDPECFQIDLESAAQRLTERTRAIMPVHLYGTACDMDAVMRFAAERGLKVIEDAAQGIGVFSGGRHTGSFGDVGCFSFFSDKTVTTGEGGYGVCRDAETFDRLRYLRNQGRLHAGTFVHPEIGVNFRITEMQAAIGLVQMAKLEEIVRRKRQIYAWYLEEFAALEEVRVLGCAPGATHVPFRCVVQAPRVAELSEHLTRGGVQCRGFFYPMHRQPCFHREFATKRGPSFVDAEYPNAVRGYEEGMCLPVFPLLEREQVGMIGGLVREFYG